MAFASCVDHVVSIIIIIIIIGLVLLVLVFFLFFYLYFSLAADSCFQSISAAILNYFSPFFTPP